MLVQLLSLFLLLQQRKRASQRSQQVLVSRQVFAIRRHICLLLYFILTVRNRAQGLSRRALGHPAISPLTALLEGGGNQDYIRAFGFNRQSFWRLVDLCKVYDANWEHVNRCIFFFWLEFCLCLVIVFFLNSAFLSLMIFSFSFFFSSSSLYSNSPRRLFWLMILLLQ